MNNKSFYTIISFVAVIGLILIGRDCPSIERFMHILICGGSFYYVLSCYQRRARLSFLMVVMALVGLLFNPIWVIPLSVPLRIIAYIVAMVLFYIIAWRTPLNE